MIQGRVVLGSLNGKNTLAQLRKMTIRERINSANNEHRRV
jgi:hypothetical protein